MGRVARRAKIRILIDPFFTCLLCSSDSSIFCQTISSSSSSWCRMMGKLADNSLLFSCYYYYSTVAQKVASPANFMYSCASFMPYSNSF